MQTNNPVCETKITPMSDLCPKPITNDYTRLVLLYKSTSSYQIPCAMTELGRKENFS